MQVGRPGGALLRGDLAKVSPDPREERWYIEARDANEPRWLGPGDGLRSMDGTTEIVRCSAPILRDGVLLGVAAFDLAIDPIRQYVADTTVEGGYCLLLSNDGRAIAHPRDASNPKRPKLTKLAAALAGDETGVVSWDDFHTSLPSFVAYAPVEPIGWSLAAVVPRQQVLAPVEEFFRRDISIMLGGLGLIILVVLMVSIRITRPIGRLAVAVRELAAGNLGARVRGVRSRDEIGEVAQAFNGMVRSLNQHVEALTRETEARKAVESELLVARRIQSSLLPSRFPNRSEFDLHAMNVPAKQVAGDFFDFFFLDEERLAFLIADVSGKGVPAALFMAMTRTVLRAQAVTGAEPAAVLNRANRIIVSDNEQTMFVTLFFGHYHMRTGQIVYANAGHNPPCIGGADGQVRRLSGSTGPILGVFGDRRYQQRQTFLNARDSLVLYTDGVTEAMDEAGVQFQLDHLERIVGQNPAASPEEMCGLVVQTVEEYRSHPQQDDVTMMVLRRNA